MSLNIIFAGTPVFAESILSKLLQSSHTIQAVFTQQDRKKGRGQHLQKSPVKILAESHQIPIYQPEKFSDPAVKNIIQEIHPDVIIVVAYGQIFPETILHIPRYGAINVHASLLPKFRGASPIQAALLAGETVTGITIMQMDTGLDTGDMLGNKSIHISKEDTSSSLHEKLAEVAGSLLLDTLNLLEQDKLVPEKQNSRFASICKKITKNQGKINWLKSAMEIERETRAFYPWPLSQAVYKDGVIFVHQAEVHSDSKVAKLDTQNTITASRIKPGTILQFNKNGLDVQTGAGVLRITKLQFPAGKVLKIQDVFNAKSSYFEIGTAFA